MYVTKRNGKQENISFDKVLWRIRSLCNLPEDIKNRPVQAKLNKNFTALHHVDYTQIAQGTIRGIYSGVSTRELDELASSIAQPLSFEHPEYGILASRILISNHHKNTITNLVQNLIIATTAELDTAELDIPALESKVKKNLFYYTAKALYENVDENGDQHPLLSPEIYKAIEKNADRLESLIDYSRDYDYDFMGFKILEESYLLKCSLQVSINSRVNPGIRKIWFPIERPQHMLMRVALGIHVTSSGQNNRTSDAKIFDECSGIFKKYSISNIRDNWSETLQRVRDRAASPDEIAQINSSIRRNTRSWNDFANEFSGEISEEAWAEIIDTYDLLSRKLFTHATPTIFNAGTLKPQLSSCFLVQLKYDSMSGITDFWKTCSEISKYAGGIGSHVHLIRGRGSYIRGTNGISNGLVPMLKVVNDISMYVDQCFHPETLIMTNTGLRFIGDLKPGDMIVTNDGSFRAIQVVRKFDYQYDRNNQYHGELSNKSSNALRMVRTWNSISPVLVTGKHPILCIDINKSGVITPEYVQSRFLDSSHYLITSIPDFSSGSGVDINPGDANSGSEWSSDMCYIYGVFIGVGMKHNQDKIIVKTPINPKIMAAVEQFCNHENITYSAMESAFGIEYEFPESRLQGLFPTSIGLDARAYRMTKYRTYRMIEGIIDVSEPVAVNNRLRISIKLLLAESLKMLLLKYNIACSGNSRATTNLEEEIYMFIDIDQQLSDLLPELKITPGLRTPDPRYFFKGNLFFSRFIPSQYEDKYVGQLVDFDIDRNHNYLTPVGIAHNGGGKRPGSHVIYIEPHHPDIFEVVSLKKARGNEAERARGLFYGMWIPDEFMRTIEYENQLEKKLRADMQRSGKLSKIDEEWIAEQVKCWYLICPDRMIAGPGANNPETGANSSRTGNHLSNLYDEEFRTTYIPDSELFSEESGSPSMQARFAFTYAYRSHIKSGNYTKKVSATALWKHICEVIEETGIPYMLYKDSCNRKSNQKNLGTIKSSNLCTEIVQYSSADEVAVCNLASINLSSVIVTEKPFDRPVRFFENEGNETVVPAIIDKFASGFETNIELIMNKLKADSSKSVRRWIDWRLLERIVRRCVRNLNRIIDINYYPIVEAYVSNMRHRPMAIGIQDFAHMLSILRIPFDSEEARQLNFYLFEFIYYTALNESVRLAREFGSYETFSGSPASSGELQFDLWEKEKIGALRYPLSLKWDVLRAQVQTGLRNSLLIGLMPTGSTSTVMGCSPCFEPFNGLVMKRRNKSGEHYIADRYLINDLIDMNLWNENIKSQLKLSSRGSIAEISAIPKIIRDIYKTVWDIDEFKQAEMSLIRAPFIDQSQSLSVFMPRPVIRDLTKYHFRTWRQGAKTGSYYTRRLAVVDANKVTVATDQTRDQNQDRNQDRNQVCNLNGDCTTCSS